MKQLTFTFLLCALAMGALGQWCMAVLFVGLMLFAAAGWLTEGNKP